MSAAEILVVEDNVLNFKLVRVLLELAGYTVVGAEDAEVALEKLTDWVPSLVLMDIQLPGMDGLELTRMLKERPEFAPIPIIAVTGYASAADEREAYAAGCVGFITKPLDTDSLMREIRRHLGDDAG